MTLQVPMLSNGSLCSYASALSQTVKWQDNFVFEDELVYIGYRGGRSSMSMVVKSTSTGAEYPMFWMVFDKLIRSPNLQPGPTFKGKWTFCKRGKNYSICPAKEEQDIWDLEIENVEAE